jgi:predicted dehydrogenase
MTVRLGIIGVGNIGLQHANNILSGVIQGGIITG